MTEVQDYATLSHSLPFRSMVFCQHPGISKQVFQNGPHAGRKFKINISFHTDG